MALVSNSVWKRISKKQYDKAHRKWVKDENDILAEYSFQYYYLCKPIYKPWCGIMAQITGEGIIGYEYYERTKKSTKTLICSPVEYDIMKKSGYVK